MPTLAVFSAFTVLILLSSVHQLILKYASMSPVSQGNLFYDRALYCAVYVFGGYFFFRILLEKTFPVKNDLKIGHLKLKTLPEAFTGSLLLLLFMLFYNKIREYLPFLYGKPPTESISALPVLLVLSQIGITPLLEEIFYRSYLCRFLCERTGFKIGLFLQAIFFAMVHDYFVAPVILAVGLVSGMMYLRHGLAGSVLTHGFYNAGILILINFWS